MIKLVLSEMEVGCTEFFLRMNCADESNPSFN